MKLKQFHIMTKTIREGWLCRPRDVQILMVQIEGIINAEMDRGHYWREATYEERRIYDKNTADAAVGYQLLKDERDKLRHRLEMIANHAESIARTALR